MKKQRLKNIIQQIKSYLAGTKRAVALAMMFGLSCGLSAYLLFFQRHFFSYRYFFSAILIALFATPLAYFLIRRFLHSIWSQLASQTQWMAVLVVCGLSAFVIPSLVSRLPPTYFLLTDAEIEITLPIQAQPNQERQVSFRYLETDLGYVHYSNLEITGDYKIIPGRVVFSPNQHVRIRWRGPVGYGASVAFLTTAFPQTVEINWNGVKKVADLGRSDVKEVIFKQVFYVPWVFQLPFLVSFFIVLNGTILAFALLLSNAPWPLRIPHKKSNWAWLAYMLPMLVAWGFTLLVFWPGMISPDSLNQMRQAFTAQYNDWHPVLHTLMIAFFLRVWPSPAVVAIAQIVFLALVVAWGCKLLREAGLPSILTWLIALLFAVFPVNAMLIVTLWKDVAYAIGFLWFTLLIIRLVLSEGRAAASWRYLAALTVSAFLVALIRTNGLPVAFATLAGLLLVYQQWRRRLAAVFIATLALVVGVRGPLYTWLDVNRTSSGQFNLPILHHIAAHVQAGTPLTEDEFAYLNALQPLDTWNYWCCYVGLVSQDKRFDKQTFLQNTRQNLEIALNLFARAPAVNTRHAVCAGEMIWRFNHKICSSKSDTAIINWKPGQERWVRENALGIAEQSLLPQFLQPLLKWFQPFGFVGVTLDWYLLPAFSLALAAFSLLVTSLRRADGRFWLAGLPIFSQAAVLFVLSLSTIYRYHYGSVIAVFFIAGLMFLPKKGQD